jgi:thiamine-monophosphate kinase
MSADEFDIIRRYFTKSQPARDDVIAGIGDDAALLRVPPETELAVSMDTLVAGVHFSENTMAEAIGHKALAVNLSDLAAMGAMPAWVTLSLTLPEVDEQWLDGFAHGFFQLANRYDMQLIGGDTTRGPLSVTIQVHGLVPAGQAVRRRGARPGDRIYVTGTLGDAGLALYLMEGAADELRQRLEYPEPRIEAGLVLHGLATAAIDISDGLLTDLGHLLEADSLGATIEVDSLPRSTVFQASIERAGQDAAALAFDLPLAAGDDYELCFTVPASATDAAEAAFDDLSCGCTRIGIVESQPGIRCLQAHATNYIPVHTGYNHFDDPDG